MMHYDKTLKRSDLIIRGLFLAVVVIGGIVGRLHPLEAAPDLAGAGAPVAAADMGLVAPATPSCRSNAEMPALAARQGRTIDTAVSQSHVLSGSVRSSAGCVPIGGAKIEFWPAGLDAADDRGNHATLLADRNGKYRLRCDFPAADAAYMYLRVSADGYTTLTAQYQPKASRAESEFDIVLQPGK